MLSIKIKRLFDFSCSISSSFYYQLFYQYLKTLSQWNLHQELDLQIIQLSFGILNSIDWHQNKYHIYADFCNFCQNSLQYNHSVFCSKFNFLTLNYTNFQEFCFLWLFITHIKQLYQAFLINILIIVFRFYPNEFHVKYWWHYFVPNCQLKTFKEMNWVLYDLCEFFHLRTKTEE